MHSYSFTEQEYNTALFSGLTEKPTKICALYFIGGFALSPVILHVACGFCLVSEYLIEALILMFDRSITSVFIQRGETALHIACRRRQITIVRLLLRNGAAVDAKTQVCTFNLNSKEVHFLLETTLPTS